METGSGYFTKVLKSLWSRSWGRWDNPAVHPCSPCFSQDCWKVNALVWEWRQGQGRIVFKKQLSQKRPSVQARFPSRQVYKHTNTLVSSYHVIYTNQRHISTSFVFFSFFNVLLQPCGWWRWGCIKTVLPAGAEGCLTLKHSWSRVDSSVAHSCRFLLLFCQVGQAVTEMLSSIFPLCFGKTAFSSPRPPTKCPSMHCRNRQVCSRCSESLLHKVRREKKQCKSIRHVHIRTHTKFTDTLDKHTPKRRKALVDSEWESGC